jgi:hypothetical protein
MRLMPAAPSWTVRPSGSAIPAIARSAAARSSVASPCRKFYGSTMPRTTSASVTVGSVPPRP